MFFCFPGRATLQNWSLILYGTNTFSIVPDVLNVTTKPKSGVNKKKNSKKQKNNVKNVVKTQKAADKLKVTGSELTLKYNTLSKNKKAQKIVTQSTATIPYDVSPYFYVVNSNKFKNSEESVKPYLKFVKNITITYPVIIPARDNIKHRDPLRKSQKQKEKSRDINSNRNLNLFTSKPTIMTATVSTKGKNAGNITFLGCNIELIPFRFACVFFVVFFLLLCFFFLAYI